MSKLRSAPRCTPPMPPVANTRMPAIAATIIVAATVVAPRPTTLPGAAPTGRAPLSRKGRSRRLALVTPRAGLADLLDLRRAQPRLQPPAHDGDGGRHGAGGAHLGFHRQGGLHVLRPGHAMADDGRFQRHHGGASGQGGSHLGMDVKQGVG